MKHALTWAAVLLIAGMAVGSLAAQVRPAPEAATQHSPTAVPPAKPAETQAAKGSLAVTKTFPLGGGEGLRESLAIDADGKFLYISRAHRTFVIDVATGKVTSEMITIGGASGVALSPETGRGFISNTRDGVVLVFDLKTQAVLGKIEVGADPGPIIYDAFTRRMLVSCEKSLVPFPPDLDLKTGKADAGIPMDARAEALVSDHQGMVYFSVRGKDQIAVVDMRVMKTATSWGLMGWSRPTSMSMDRVHSRLYIACKTRLVVMSASDGHVMADFPLGAGVDSSAFFDGKAYVGSTNGSVTVVGQDAEGNFEVQQTLQLEDGVRSLVVHPQSGVIYALTAEMEKRKAVAGTAKILVMERK